MENLKLEPFDEREEGEISLDDVSSSEETNYGASNRNSKKSGVGKKHIKRENSILTQDTCHGKENRRFLNELIGTGPRPITATLQAKNEDLLPISSDEDIEFVGLPGTSRQLAIHLGPKKKRKKKKKKKSGQRMLVKDDLVSTFDDEPDALGIVADDRRDFIVSRPYGNATDRLTSPIHRINSPPRHTGWHLPRSPPKHYHSPLKHGRSPNRRSLSPRQRSPRKFLSPRKPLAFTPDRRASHNPPRDSSPGRYGDAYASSLLKKVRHLETVGLITPGNQQKYKESSLKDKLSKMMIKSSPEVKESVDNRQLEIGNNRNIGVKTDDEEDLEFLRRKALETKQLKNNVKSEEINGTYNAESNVGGNVNVSDDDEEDLELRMIALRSAVMKKHQNRVQRGIIKKKIDTNIKDESPFRDSFLDSLDNYSDGDADETNNESHRIGSPIVHLSNIENARVEDMDLDSDIEREKEYSEPYSPTDDLSDQTLAESVLPGVSPMEMSINEFLTLDVEQNSLNVATSQYSDNFTHYFNDQRANVTSPYSPSDPTCTPRVDISSRQQPAVTSRDPRLRRHINTVMELPYSANDIAVLNPTLQMCSPEISFPRTPLNTNMNSRTSNLANLISVPLENNLNNISSTTPTPFQRISLPLSSDSNAPDGLHNPEKTSTKETSVVIDNVQSNVTYNDIVRDLAEYTGEPLYLQGVPDITKDVNKIPTLVNRTLVPVTILKTNKQLQQPLPNKKSDGNGEPTFKSAEMLPVNVQSQSIKSNTVFKPMKLPPVAKKGPLINTPAAAFNTTLNHESNAALSNDHGTKTAAHPDIPIDNKSSDNSQATVLSRSVVTSEDQLKTKVRRPRTPRTKTETIKKSQQKISASGKATIVANEKLNNKTSIKRTSKTPENKDNWRKNTRSTEVKQIDVNNAKHKDVKKPDPKKGKRSKNVTKFENASGENLKNNSNLSKNNDIILKQKKEITKKVSKPRTTKNLESNVKKANVKKSITLKTDDKKRRSSIDDDEEALRAALLASLPKRKKTSDSQFTATTSKSSTESANSVRRKSNDTKVLLKEKQQSETTVMIPPTTIPPRSVSKQNTADQNKATVNTMSGGIAGKKRLNTSNDQGPTKKIAKTPTASSDADKILNVAEKIVDNEIQRKLALQQAAIDLLCNKTTQNPKTNLPRPNTKDSTGSINTKISASRSLERMIIRLGEDSDSDSDDPDDDPMKAKTAIVNVPSKEINKAPAIPTTDFEKSVEEFLRSQREKQESSITIPISAAAKSLTSTPQKQTAPITSTPLAVRHLPASKQEEYRRLKQCIAELEQQKMNRPVPTTTKNKSHTSFTNECTSTASASTSTTVANDNISTVKMHSPLNTARPNTDVEIPPVATSQPCTSISIQTQISQSAMELLQPTIKVDTIENNNLISTPLLPDIPIKTDPSLLETISNIADDNPKVNINMPNNRLNEDASDLNSIGPTRPLDNLTIQFPNTRDDSYVRYITINRSDHVSNEQAFTPPVTSLGLRILTTDQLNMKFEHTQTDITEDENQVEDRKVILNESVQMIDNDILSIPRSTIENIDINTIDSAITFETCKIESNGHIIEPSVLTHQMTTDSEALTVMLHSQNDGSVKYIKNDGLDATIELDSTIDLDSTTIIDGVEITNFPKLTSSMDIQDTSSYNAQTSTNPELAAQEQGQDLLDKIEIDIQTQLETLYNLPEHQKHVQLTTWEKELVAKRYVVLHNLTQITEDLRQWEIQTELAAEVKRLRTQLQIAEERLQAQRAITMNIRPQVTLTQTTINEGRVECMKLSNLCREIGSKVMGAAYKIPKTGDQLLKEKLREVASMTKQLSKKKTVSIGQNEEQNNDMMTTQLTSNDSCNEHSEPNLRSTNHNLEANQHSTSVKIENPEDLKAVLVDVSCDTSTETLLNVPMQGNTHVIHESTEAVNDDTLSASTVPSIDSQFIENTSDVNTSTIANQMFKTEDEKPPMQPTVSYESVLIASNTPRLNGLSSIMSEHSS